MLAASSVTRTAGKSIQTVCDLDQGTWKSHLSILRCPNTGSSLVKMAADSLSSLNLLIANGEMRHLDGGSVVRPVKEALCSIDQKIVYPIEDDVICFIPSEAIDASQSILQTVQLSESAGILRKFYDEFGWTKADDCNFQDAAVFDDQRAVSADYIRKCHLRLNKYLSKGGRYLLDAASGPIQFDEYLTYDRNFDYRICLDLSIAALKHARRRLGKKGLYILADITNIPIRDNAIDGVVSLHTIYHVDQALQSKALCELYRVLSPGREGVVVYTWGSHSILNKLLEIPAAVTKPLRNAAKAVSSRGTSAPPLYFHPHGLSWFKQQNWPFRLEISSWRSISVTVLKTYIHEWLLGRQMLEIVFALEERFPKLLGRFGQYPIIHLFKPSQG